MLSRITAALASTLLSVLLLVAPANAAFPGKNGKIAFESDRTGAAYEIYSANPDGTALARLTNNTSFDWSPAWSPDGAKVAFATDRDSPPPGAPNPQPNLEIYSMSADGSGQTNLSHDPGTDLDPSWSPDATKIVFASGRDGADLNTFFPTTDLYVMNADGTGQTRLTFDEDTIDSRPVWSPQGTKIAYQQETLYIDDETGDFRTIGPDIWVMDATGNGRSILAGSAREPDWSPEGTRIAFVRYAPCPLFPCEPTDQIWTMNADGTNAQEVHNGLTGEREPAWSPDGSKIAFTLGGEIYTMNADGTAVANITNAPSSQERSPDWQPLPAPSRDDFKNAAKFCKAERDFVGDAAFAQKYGGGADAHGKCVSQNH